MSWFTGLRYLVLARRGVLALERIATATTRATQIAEARSDREQRKYSKVARQVVEFGSLDQEAVNDRWKHEHEEAMVGEDEDDR